MEKSMLGQRSAKVRVGKSDRRWLACLIDSEGTVNLTPYPRLEVTNANAKFLREALRIVRSIIAESIPPPLYRYTNGGYRPYWKLTLFRYAAVEKVLGSILPYLIVKDRQARLVLRWIEISPRRVFGPRVAFHGKNCPANVWTHEHRAIVAELRRLNKRYSKAEWQAQRTTERRALQPTEMKKRSVLTSNRERRQK